MDHSTYMVYSCWSKLANVVSEVPQGGVWTAIVPPVHLTAILYTGEQASQLCQ